MELGPKNRTTEEGMGPDSLIVVSVDTLGYSSVQLST